MSVMGRRVEQSPVHVRWEPVKISLTALILGWLFKRTVTVVVALVRSPVALTTLAAIGLTVWGCAHSPGATLAAWLVLVVGLITWRLRWPHSFERRVGLVLRGRWRRWSVYRWKWQASIDTAGLNAHRQGVEYLPALLTVCSTRSVDRVRVRMLPGQTQADWAKVVDRLCQTFGAQDARVRSVSDRPHELDLWFLTTDPLLSEVTPVPAVKEPTLTGLPVGVREDGETYRLRLLGTHVLVVGATGSGKGSVLWSTILQLVPAVCTGLVRIWALDPKGGMELAAGAAVFDRFVHGDTDTGGLPQTSKGFEEQFAEVLEDAVVVMRRRQNLLRGKTRLHTPTAAEPFLVVLVDELAALTGYVSDRDCKRRIGNALGLLLSQGRAVGVTVVAAVQDPRKETIPARDLFPTRIGLRLNEAEQCHLVLGPGARDRGARCDTIPDTLPGVGYVQVDGVAEPVRVRFAHVTDDHIRSALHATPLFGALSTGSAGVVELVEPEERAA